MLKNCTHVARQTLVRVLNRRLRCKWYPHVINVHGNSRTRRNLSYASPACYCLILYIVGYYRKGGHPRKKCTINQYKG